MAELNDRNDIDGILVQSLPKDSTKRKCCWPFAGKRLWMLPSMSAVADEWKRLLPARPPSNETLEGM